MFGKEAVMTLLSRKYPVERMQDARRGPQSIDGTVSNSLTYAGFHEYVHNPSLAFHIGVDSTMHKRKQPDALSFRGEDFDSLELLKEQK